MATSIFPHVLPVIWKGIVFDRSGIGATARSSHDAALWVAMRPSVFLAIATPLPQPRSSLGWLRGRLEDGQAIAPAELHFDVDVKVPLALAHEGRHRMTALGERMPDRAVPVRLSFRGLLDGDVDEAFIARIRNGTKSQRGRSYVEGPLFDDAEIDLGGPWTSGVPPPLPLEDRQGVSNVDIARYASLRRTVRVLLIGDLEEMGRWIDWTSEKSLSPHEVALVSDIMRSRVIPSLAAVVSERNKRSRIHKSWISSFALRLLGDTDMAYAKSAGLLAVGEVGFVVKAQSVPADSHVPFSAGAWSVQSVGIQDYVLLSLLGVIHTVTGSISSLSGDELERSDVALVLSRVAQASGFEFSDLATLVLGSLDDATSPQPLEGIQGQVG